MNFFVWYSNIYRNQNGIKEESKNTNILKYFSEALEFFKYSLLLYNYIQQNVKIISSIKVEIAPILNPIALK